MKKIGLIILFSFLPFIRLAAQISEIEQIFRSHNNDYVYYTSIVRNYDKEHNVLSQYGYFTNEPRTDTIKGYSSFMIQNTTTGDIKHIFDLPKGYQVNDVRFVTLRKIDGVTTEDFCCFCGTRTELGNQGYLTRGFAGFFSMQQALNPSSSYTAKVRDVERTIALYRMVCYAEEYGYYHQLQNSFIDNAVLDIIGLEDTVNGPSCFCRAKFYPDVYGGVRWDNNIRANSNEVLTDITLTNDYVVTTSNSTRDNDLWIRYSDIEYYLYLGGMPLNDDVNSIDFTTLIVNQDCENNEKVGKIFRKNPAKICFTRDNGVEISYHIGWEDNEGLINSQYDYPNGTLTFQKGAYLECVPNLKELIHMPLNGSTAILYGGRNNDIVSILTWRQNELCKYPVKQYWDEDILFQSITLQKRNSYEHLLWSGMERNNPFSPLYLLSQRGALGGGDKETCHKENDVLAKPVTIEHRILNNPMPIVVRFPYNSVLYPVTFIPLIDEEIEKDFPCIKK